MRLFRLLESNSRRNASLPSLAGRIVGPVHRPYGETTLKPVDKLPRQSVASLRPSTAAAQDRITPLLSSYVFCDIFPVVSLLPIRFVFARGRGSVDDRRTSTGARYPVPSVGRLADEPAHQPARPLRRQGVYSDDQSGQCPQPAHVGRRFRASGSGGARSWAYVKSSTAASGKRVWDRTRPSRWPIALTDARFLSHCMLSF
jgi:hypothetical protein